MLAQPGDARSPVRALCANPPTYAFVYDMVRICIRVCTCVFVYCVFVHVSMSSCAYAMSCFVTHNIVMDMKMCVSLHTYDT